MYYFIIAQVLLGMEVSLAQRRFLLELLGGTWLSVRGRFNFINLSRYSCLHERTLRRWFARGFDWGLFNQLFLVLVIPAKHEVIAAVDTTFIPKSGKKTAGLGYFFNSVPGRVEPGLECKLLSVVDVTANTAYALDGRQTISRPHMGTGKKKETQKKETGKKTGRGKKKRDMADASRLAEHLRHVEEARRFLPQRVRYLAADGYYACREFVDGVCRLGLAMVSKLRHNANLRYPYEGERNRRGRPRLYGDKVLWDQVELWRWQNEGEVEQGVRLYSAQLYHMTLKRVIKVALLLKTQGSKTQRVLLFSTDIALEGKQIHRFYKARFQIEFLFRDAKQGTGLCDCQARNGQALEFHWNASLCAVNLAKWKQLERSTESRFSLASSMQRYANERFVEMISRTLDFDLTAIKSHPCYETLCNYGVICP